MSINLSLNEFKEFIESKFLPIYIFISTTNSLTTLNMFLRIVVSTGFIALDLENLFNELNNAGILLLQKSSMISMLDLTIPLVSFLIFNFAITL